MNIDRDTLIRLIAELVPGDHHHLGNLPEHRLAEVTEINIGPAADAILAHLDANTPNGRQLVTEPSAVRIELTSTVESPDRAALTAAEVRGWVALLPGDATIEPVLWDAGSQRDPDHIILIGLKATWTATTTTSGDDQ